MYKRIQYFFFFLITISCIEPYEFRIQNNEPTVVIEGLISDKSFTESLSYPSDGRYFTVKLSRTSDVINVRPEMISGALVRLINDLGEEWEYTESDQTGVYVLPEEDFKALAGIKYKLRVALAEDDLYESDWQELPAAAPAMGEIGFRETEVRRLTPGGLKTIAGVTPNISIPTNNTGHAVYYRWKFTPTWIYIAPLAATTSSNNKRVCWASNPLYIRNYTVQLDREGGYTKDFFFIDIDGNERVLEEFSLLVEQHIMTEENYYFWKEMQDLNHSGSLFDTPPYNLKTNFHSLNGEKMVSGYFGVMGEQSKRWYFNVKDLSYSYENTLFADCSTPCGPGCPPPNCANCLRYEGGKTTNVSPTWWGR